jgi:hypothetical protein
MSSKKGFFLVTGTGETVYVDGVTPEEFAQQAPAGSVKAVDTATGQEFEPQALISDIIKGGLKTAETAVQKLYRYTYKFTGTPKAAETIASDVATAEKISKIPIGTAESGAISKSSVLGDLNTLKLQKSAEIQKVVEDARSAPSVLRPAVAGESADVSSAKQILSEMDGVLADKSVASVITDSERTQLLTARQGLKGSLDNIEAPIISRTDESLAVAREQLANDAKITQKTLDNIGKNRLENWSVIGEDALAKGEKTALQDTLKMSAAQEADRAAAKTAAEGLQKDAVGKVTADSLFGKITGKTVLLGGITAAVGIAGISAAVGIVSAGGLGSKAGTTPGGNLSPEDQKKLAALQQQMCGTVDDFKQISQFAAEPEKYYALCTECVNSLDVTQEEATQCFKDNLAQEGLETDICSSSGLDATTMQLCKQCQAEVSDPQSVDLVSACIQGKGGNAAGVGGGAGGAGTGGGGGGAATDGSDAVKAAIDQMCADNTLTSDQQGLCKECENEAYAGGKTYPETQYDTLVTQIQNCYAEKTKAVSGDPHELCNSSSFTTDEKAKCTDCVDSVVGTQNWSSLDESTKSGLVTKIQDCFNQKTGSVTDICSDVSLDETTRALCKQCQTEVADPQDVDLVAMCIQDKQTAAATTDICSDASLDATTKALCKSCQGEVSDPQSVDLVAACIQDKLNQQGGGGGTTPTGTSPCDDPTVQLTDDEYTACVDCYTDGMAIADLQDCMIDKIAANTGTVPVCDINDPSYDLATCMGKVCDPTDALYSQEACDYFQGTVVQPYYGQGEAVVDTMDPCDTSSEMFDATACTNAGGQVYTSAILAESAPSALLPILLLGGAAALIAYGFKESGKTTQPRK